MSKRIYIVDDDPDMVKVLAFRIRSKGFETSSFTSGRKALDTMIKTPPDLIIVDIQMPEMTGKEVEKAMEEHESLENIPIIFLTGRTDLDKSSFKENTALMIKPCDFDLLVDEIQKRIR